MKENAFRNNEPFLTYICYNSFLSFHLLFIIYIRIKFYGLLRWFYGHTSIFSIGKWLFIRFYLWQEYWSLIEAWIDIKGRSSFLQFCNGNSVKSQLSFDCKKMAFFRYSPIDAIRIYNIALFMLSKMRGLLTDNHRQHGVSAGSDMTCTPFAILVWLTSTLEKWRVPSQHLKREFQNKMYPSRLSDVLTILWIGRQCLFPFESHPFEALKVLEAIDKVSDFSLSHRCFIHYLKFQLYVCIRYYSVSWKDCI